MQPIIEKIDKEFDGMIEEIRDVDFDFRYGVFPHQIERFKKFNHSSIKEVLKELKRWVEEQKKEITCTDDGSTKMCERCDMNIPYNWAMNDLLAKLSNEIKELE